MEAAQSQEDTSSAFNWNGLLSEVIKEGSGLVKASIDKPISNATQTQQTNQITPAAASSQAVAVANQKPLFNWVPLAIGGGALVILGFLVIALKSAKS